MTRFLPLALTLLLAGNMLQPGFAQTTHAPIQAGGVVAIDLPDSSAKSMTLDIVEGRFSDYSAGRMTLTGNGIDLRNGTLSGLQANVQDGHFDELLIDRLNLSTGAFSFDTMALLNDQTFILHQPVAATVKLELSEAGLNQFIRNPKTIEKLEKAIKKQTGGIQLIRLTNPGFQMMGGNKVKLSFTGVLGQAVSVPLELAGQLSLQNGQLKISQLALANGGEEFQLPLDIAKVLEQRLNEMIDFQKLGKNSLVIQGQSMKFQGKKILIDGTATLTKLQFGL